MTIQEKKYGRNMIPWYQRDVLFARRPSRATATATAASVPRTMNAAL
jgi:hypothetical protein